MRTVACLFAAAALANAGVVQGVVLEQASGQPLSRTLVRLDPVPGPQRTDVRPLQVRTGRAGQFVFPPVLEGLYFVTAQRTGYFPVSHGQRRPTGYGTPVPVTADSQFFTELRMRRMGAITGKVLDENGIGIPGVPLIAYRARLPLRSASRGVSDDRGVYRISGLDPGKYWVRTGAHTLDDGSGLVPTFGPQSRELRDARIHEARTDEDTLEAHVRPEFGSLYRVAGKVLCDRSASDGPPLTVTLSSETARRNTQTTCGGYYAFESIALGAYELFATYPDGSGGGFLEMSVSQNTESANIQLMRPPLVQFEVRSASGEASQAAVHVVGRRADLSAAEPAQEIMLPRATLAPGHWEMNASAGPGQYVESIRGDSLPRRPWRTEQPAEWHDVFIEGRPQARVTITISDRASQIIGSVAAGQKPVPGAPVFLWPVAEAARRILGGPRQMLSDTEGKFRFEGLPPGDYRLLATFDYREVDMDVLEEAHTPVTHVEASQATIVELPLWLAP